MKSLLRNLLAATAVGIATQAIAQVTFYEQDGFRGQSFTTARQLGNLERSGFNDRAVGGLRRRSVQRSMCRLASGPVSVVGRDGLERPRFVGAGRGPDCAYR
jgi:hypothetical protein